MKSANLFFLLLLMVIVSSCNVHRTFYGKGEGDWEERKIPDVPVKYTVYLVGGLDYEKSKTTNSFTLLKKYVNPDDTSHAIVYLDDRIYKKPQTDEDKLADVIKKKEIDVQLNFLQNDKGKHFFIAGHDKANSKRRFDPAKVKDHIEKETGKKNTFLPEDGCAGPDKVKLTDDLVLIPINTSFFIWEQNEKKKNKDCEVNNETEWYEKLNEEIDDNQRKNLLVVSHHPPVNLGNHGGWFSWKQHIFPLTDLNKNFYLPLPVIGSLYPITRIALGFRNDRAYPPHNRMRKRIMGSVLGYTNLVYASGLERNFQFFKYEKEDFIVTSSANKPSFANSFRSKFISRSGGITRLTYLENGEVWMEMITMKKGEDRVIYRKRLKDNVYKAPNDSTAITPRESVKDSVITIAADTSLEVGKFKKFLLGEHYRYAWMTPVKVPLLDLQEELGGLKILKKGGGKQTKSLHLESPSGEEYTLRSIVKYPERLLGRNMANTIYADIIKDQSSSTHPYAPVVVDNLSDISGILHNAPKVVYLPNDAALEEYRREYANTLMIFEKKADGEIQPSGNYRYIEKAVSSEKMLEQLEKDNGVAVDDYAFLKSRLFDMWINDWDRHQDQWRWGEVECKDDPQGKCGILLAEKKYFVPIPKDRDQAFARFDGVLPWIAGRKWAGRRFQDFKEDIRDVPGINFNARNIDHAILSRLPREEWIRLAEELEKELTDEKIEKAIRNLPDTIYQHDGPFITNMLKARRNKISEFAERQYKFLSRYVDVKGSDGNERFEITRLNNDTTLVRVYDINDGKNRLIYERNFLRKETKEIRIYGREGSDVFNISGEVKKGILVRIIGGEGRDSIADKSSVSNGCRKTQVYDSKQSNEISRGKETRIHSASLDTLQDYKFFSYDYNLLAPATFFGYNRDDGIFIGGGILIKNHGFRKEPYAFKQRIVANVSLRELSFNLLYTGEFIGVIGPWGIHTDVNVLAPKSTTNFFGLGNETPRFIEDDEYYRLRYDEVYVYPGFKRHLGEHHDIKIGPVYEYTKVNLTAGRFLSGPEGLPYATQITERNLGGAKLEYEFMSIDDSVLTFRGIRWLVSAIWQTDLNDNTYQTANLESQLRIYVPLANRVTLAMRFGGATRFNDFDFFQANTLGGHSLKRENGNLRGYLRGRYSGRSVAYLNTDVRLKLFVIRTYLFPAHFGILGFYDTGRVWQDDEKSNVWHNGYGAGVWIDPFARTVINLTYGISKEEKLFTIAMGFLF